MQQDNRIFLNPKGFIEVDLVGDQTDESFQHAYYTVEPLLEQLRNEGKPILGLIDMTDETGYSLSSNKAALEVLEKIDYVKIAMCNPPHAGVVEGLILAMGKSNNTKIFDNRDAAIEWLLA